MADVASWASCVGAWLLVGGAAHQAALDLRAEQDLSERFDAARRAGDQAEPVSRWWLLLPPAYIAKRHRRAEEQQREVVLGFEEDEHLRLIRYLNQAFGWVVVGMGALLLAVAATVDLGDAMGWSGRVTAAAVAVAAALAFTTIAGQTRRTDRSHEEWRRLRAEREAEDG